MKMKTEILSHCSNVTAFPQCYDYMWHDFDMWLWELYK